MSENSGYLIHTTKPELVKNNHRFSVKNKAVRLYAYGLFDENDKVTLNHRVGDQETGDYHETWRNGTQIVLTNENTQHVEIVEGNYRLETSLVSPDVRVYFETSDLGIDRNAGYELNV